ncbi:MAG: tetratricopeptide repeat protein [Deltaproteobacteria bacterium]|nr:tetratricopeptide repeat protein [Deltaproteobacteria bacterium]
MADQFCVQCGAALLPEARFCTACGTRAGGRGLPLRRGSLGRWAPLIVLATVLGVGALAIGLGVGNQNLPNVPPPRAGGSGGAGAGGGAMPPDHPPVSVPEDVKKVIAHMVEVAKEKPDDLDAWRQLGFVQYRAGQVDPAYLADAITTYQHVLAKDPKDLDALRALGNIAYDQNDPRQALEIYKRYLGIKPDDLGVQTDMGTMLLADKQVDAAKQTYQAVLTKDPTFFQAQFNLAIAYRAEGDEAKALAALRRARDIATDDETRQRVDMLLARVGEPGGGGAADEPPRDLRTDVEAVFRAHPIAGSRIDRIDWASDQMARVVLREFPMDGMPPMVRDKFIERIKNGVRDAKARHQVNAPITIELVDAGEGRVMATVVE